jgi:hypothetical protein
VVTTGQRDRAIAAKGPELKTDRQFWMAKLRAVKKVWRGVNPQYTTRGGRVGGAAFDFASERALAAGIKVCCLVSGWKGSDETWSMRVRIALYDDRVAALQSVAMGLDVTSWFVDCDVLAASSVVRGEELPYAPSIDLNCEYEEIAGYLQDVQRRIEAIWQVVGGCRAENVEHLAMWIIHNRMSVGAKENCVGIICATFVYGHRLLSRELLADYAAHWQRLLRVEPSESVLTVYGNVRSTIDRLEQAMAAQTIH